MHWHISANVSKPESKSKETALIWRVCFWKEYIYQGCNVAHQATWIMRGSRWEGGWIMSAAKWEGWWQSWAFFAGAFIRNHLCIRTLGLSFGSAVQNECFGTWDYKELISGVEPWMTKLSPQIISRRLAKHWAKVLFFIFGFLELQRTLWS